MRIRVENQSHVQISEYGHSTLEKVSGELSPRPFTALFIKPYVHLPVKTLGPPLGILTLISCLRERFGNTVNAVFWDMVLEMAPADALTQQLERHQPDVIAISSLNVEANVSYELIKRAKAWSSKVLCILGGPLALRQSKLVFDESEADWVFEGAADRTLPIALARHFSDVPLGTDLPGFSYRNADVKHITTKQDLLTDLDEIPLPAWDLIDFERYASADRPRIITNVDERRYAYLFTSRGCPYLCNYCHDVFTKKFIYRSVDNVIAEMRLLYDEYQVREFHFVDDIFNLHKPRVIELMHRIRDEFDGVYLAYPNGLRADILDAQVIKAMVDAGTYHASISIETVTPRLQEQVEKHLDIEKAQWAIEEFGRYGVVVHGAFMVGFPGETVKEINQTINYAMKSSLSHAFFFAVVPQPQTPIFEKALLESRDVTLKAAKAERGKGYDESAWYQKAYGYNLQRRIFFAFLQFYLYPPRLLKLFKLYGLKFMINRFVALIRRAFNSLRNN